MVAASRRATSCEGLAEQDQVGIVGDETARGPQVDDRPRRRALIAVGVDVGHHVVPELFLVNGRGFEIDVVDMLPQFRELAVGDRQTEFVLGLCQGHPQLARDPVPANGAPNRAIASTRIA